MQPEWHTRATRALKNVFHSPPPVSAATDTDTATPAPRKMSHAPQVPDWRTPARPAIIVQPPTLASLAGCPSAFPARTHRRPNHTRGARPPTGLEDGSRVR